MQVRAKIEEDDRIDVEDNNALSVSNHSAINFIPSLGKTSFDTLIRLCKENIIDQEQVSETNLLRRLSKFFEYNKNIEPGREYFTDRKESNQRSPLVDNQIIIFGCDFKKLRVVREEYMTSQSVLINPSNYKLIYSDAGTAWKAIETNALDQKALANKRQSEEDPLPRCWIEMKPYTFHNRLIKVFVRYATEEERHVQPVKERWADTYNRCRQIYNSQEEERKSQLFLDQELKRERLERPNKYEQNEQQRGERQDRQRPRQRQTNSAMLYEYYNSINEQQWNRGKNQNPGASKEDNKRVSSRSRSRSMGKTNKQGFSTNPNVNITELNHYIKNIQLEDNNNNLPLVDASFELVDSRSRSQYQWNGKKRDQSTNYNWSYSQYMRRVDEEEEMKKRHRESKIMVITLDD